jgi:hypothetical protein
MKTIGTGFPAFLLLALFASPYGLSYADETGYRLSGIMGSDPGKAFAVIENADGEQQLLSEGSAVGPGYVKSISSQFKTVILAFPDGEIELRLTGSGKPDVGGAGMDEVEKAYSIDDYDTEAAEQKILDPEALVKLQRLASDDGELSEMQLRIRLNEALGLPEEARIATYEEQAAPSIRELLARINTRNSDMTDSGAFLGRIAVSDRNGSRRIYLMTGSEGE